MWIDHGGDTTASLLATTRWRMSRRVAHEVHDALVVAQAEVEIHLASGGRAGAAASCSRRCRSSAASGRAAAGRTCRWPARCTGRWCVRSRSPARRAPAAPPGRWRCAGSRIAHAPASRPGRTAPGWLASSDSNDDRLAAHCHVQAIVRLQRIRGAVDGDAAGASADIDHAQFAAFQEGLARRGRGLGLRRQCHRCGRGRGAADHDPFVVGVVQPHFAGGEQAVEQVARRATVRCVAPAIMSGCVAW